MAAPKGHPRWGNPLNHKKLTPEELWEGAQKYFEWADNNPWYKNEQIKQRPIIPKDSKLSARRIKEILDPIIKIPTQRPYTIEGLCMYLNITRQTFENYSNAVGYETYFDVSIRIRDIINSQHFEGGMVGIFDSGLAARKLGLIEKMDMQSGGKPIQRTIIKWGDKEIEV
jgi:hypothetical protein